jgi:hypothetical protein
VFFGGKSGLEMADKMQKVLKKKMVLLGTHAMMKILKSEESWLFIQG